MFDFTNTVGGKAALYRRLKNPFTNIQDIKSTQTGIKYLSINYKVWDSNNQERQMAYIEKYLNSNIIPFQYKSKWRSRIKAYFYRKKYHEEWDFIYTGIKHFCFFVNKI